MKNTSKLITVILIIMIIAVVGIVSYYTFDYVKNKQIDKEALQEIDQFDQNLPTLTLAEYEDQINKGLINESEFDDEVDDPYSSGSSSSSSSNQRDLDKLFAPKVVGTIRIPKTDIRYPIYTPSGEKVLERGIGMLATTKGINKPGNTTLQGHNWRNWMFFSRNHLLTTGDSIFIKDRRGVQVEYIVYKKMTLKPTDAKYITRNTNGKREISLSTCTNATQDRLVILAREK